MPKIKQTIKVSKYEEISNLCDEISKLAQELEDDLYFKEVFEAIYKLPTLSNKTK